MKRESEVKKKVAVRKLKNGTLEWADHQTHVQIEAQKKKRKEWESSIEKSKKNLSLPDAERYLNGGMEVLEHFAGSAMYTLPDIGPRGENCFLGGLANLVAAHAVRCLNLLCKTALAGDQNAARTVWNASVTLARVIDLIVKERPECLDELTKNPETLRSLRAWEKAGEIAVLSCDSVLKLDEKTTLQTTTPATRFVLDFMRQALKMRSEMLGASQFFNDCQQRPETPGQFTLDDYLVDKCKFPREQLIYKDLPDFTSESWSAWWDRALKPFLDQPKTLWSIRCDSPTFFKTLKASTTEWKDYQIKDELKKRCRAALKNLAKGTIPHSAP